MELLCRYLLLLTLLTTSDVHAQQRNANWIFGEGLWVQFAADTFSILPQPEPTSRRTACMSDPQGQFLLLADDHGIRNAEFLPLTGGTAGALGWEAPMANYLILPHPGNAQRYFVFTVQGSIPAQAGYVEVDLSSGDGAVVGGGTQWFMADATAKLAATLDAAGTGYWVVLHEAEGDAFHAYHLTTEGFDTTPVISHAASNYLPHTPPYPNMDRWGTMDFSVQGDKLAAINHGVALDTNAIDLLRFDTDAGVVTSWVELPHTHYIQSAYSAWQHLELDRSGRYRGIEFDLSGGYLYAFIMQDEPGSPNHLVQFPVYHEDAQAILDTARQLYGIPGDGALTDSLGDGLITGLDHDLHLACLVPHWEDRLFKFRSLPVVWPYTVQMNQYVDVSTLPQGVRNGHFPNQCRNYHDSHPIGLGLAPREDKPSFRVWPSPMGRQATLQWNGGEQPTAVRWFDAWGRLVRQEWLIAGPASPIQRGDLPAGLYVLQLLAGNHPLGTVRMVCE